MNKVVYYTAKIHKAQRIATHAHQNQTRKGTSIPYITHPLSVGIILSRIDSSEDIIVAGILHDTIEDCGFTKDYLEKEFGKNVARMVNDLTEQDKSLPWEERKKLALEHIKQMQKDSILVKSADVLQNMTDQLADYKTEGNNMFDRFNAPKEKQLDRYQKLVRELEKKWKENPLLSELKGTFGKILVEWKNR